MKQPLDRNKVIELLNELGDSHDDTALTAARTLHGQITSSGLGWGDLLVADDADKAIDFVGKDAKDQGVEDSSPSANPEITSKTSKPPSEEDTKTLKLIDALLSQNGFSREFCSELEQYKNDIIIGNFNSSDHQYIQALHRRLLKT